jgi:sugar lactone lactonase YvrE
MKQNMKTSATEKMEGLTCKLLILTSLVSATVAFGASLHNGCEVFFADSQAAVLRANTVSGALTLVSQNQKLIQPFGIAIGASGEVFVSDTGCSSLIGINPLTGEQRLVSAGGILALPLGIAIERSGMLLVADTACVMRINPDSGTQKVVSSGNLLKVPLAVAIGANDLIYVLDALGAVIAVDPRTASQSLVSKGGYLNRPQGIALSGKTLYVTDVASADGNFGVGRIIKIDIHSGRQTLLSEGANLVGPVGISVEPSGHLVVADPYTMVPNSADVFDGAIIRVDEKNGAQNLIACGSGTFVNPRAVAVVPNSAK